MGVKGETTIEVTLDTPTVSKAPAIEVDAATWQLNRFCMDVFILETSDQKR